MRHKGILRSARELSAVDVLAVSISCHAFVGHFLLPALAVFRGDTFGSSCAGLEANCRAHPRLVASFLIAPDRCFILLNLSFHPAGFRTGYADCRTGSGNANTLPRSSGGNHFETL